MVFKKIAGLAFFLVAAAMAIAQNQKTDYDASWKKIDELVNKKGLPKSALTEVDAVYVKAKKEGNNPQLIRALIYKINLGESQDESSGINGIKEMEKEKFSVAEPARSIIASIEAGMYWTYLQNNRYQFYNRTNTKNFIKTDIATWTLDDLHKKITELWLESLKNEKQLQQTSLETYGPIIIPGNTRRLRPTLYDLLAHRALDYFKNDERMVYQAATIFTIKDAAAFGDALAFSTHPFNDPDTASRALEAIRLFQKLTRFHLHDKDPSALIDLDIERIPFVYSHTSLENKEGLYMGALAEIYSTYHDNPLATRAAWLLAAEYQARASLYQPLRDTIHRYDLVTAKKICKDVMKQPDSSEGKSNCANMLHNIELPAVKTEAEIVNSPGQLFRMLVSFKNVITMHFRVLKLDPSINVSLGTRTWDNDYWQKLLRLKPVGSFDQALPDTKDYQLHTAEIKINALPVGEYAIVASCDPGFKMEQNQLSMQRLYISNISYIQNERDFFVLNRESGQPIVNATVQVWYRLFEKGNEVTRKGEQFNTGKNGLFTITPSKTNSSASQQLEITSTDDHLFMDDEQPLYAYYQEPVNDKAATAEYERKNLQAYLFTDRAIYRPGQTVFFKGMLVTKDATTHKYKIQQQYKSKVYLVDVNGTHVDSLQVTTNEFGSYHGVFKLPENRLNGRFTIEDDATGNEQGFSVEEYKRPAFYVSYAEQKKASHLNDSVEVSGSAKAYAGNTINGAKVSYRVVRNPRFMYSWLFQKWAPRNSRPAEIANGTTTTDENGNFTIHFKALPDASIDKRSDPVFDYQVSVDITDMNGETRSAEKRITVGYHSITLSIASPEAIGNDSLATMTLSSNNLSGEPLATTGTLEVYKLKMPGRLTRSRYWEQPDQFVMTEKEYHGFFPYDEYSNETQKENWEKTATATWSDSIRSATPVSISTKKLDPGWYLVVTSAKDPQGDSVTDHRYIQVYDAATGDPGMPQYQWTFNNKHDAEPGSKVVVKSGSSASNVFVIQKISPADSETDSAASYHFIQLDHQQQISSFQIGEPDRGGFGVDYAFVKNNRVFISSNSIQVPWTNKELDIRYESFRDKTLPGENEKWKIKITGYKQDKIAAEAVAAMYDASLDQFQKQNWQVPGLYPVYESTVRWSTMNFSSVNSIQKNSTDFEYPSFYSQYDQLLSVTGRSSLEGKATGISSSLALENSDYKMPMAAKLKRGEQNIIGNSVEFSDSVAVDGKDRDNNQPNFQPRKNFNETAFFFPDLKTDSSGAIEFSFTMPEALTQWKWMSLAHTKDLAFGYSEKNIITQKQLMVQPNLPRFLREGDKIDVVTRIVNMTDSELTGQVGLQLLDPSTNQPVDGWFQNMQANQYFTVPAHQSVPASFPLEIPFLYNKPVTWRILASTTLSDEKHNKIVLSDGEENTLPVLSNRMLVTESLPINMKAPGKKTVSFPKLLNSGSSETLSQHSVTVEFTSNPAWYAVQALPYLMEFPYECAEQTFNRFYANALAASIVSSSPRVKAIFEKWKTADTAALLSNLQKNEELKSVLLEETPWVLQAKTESEQKKNLALLFDMVKMSAALQSTISKLSDMQGASGGFPWFKGGPDDRYITQYILTGIGRLQKLHAIPEELAARVQSVIKPALAWADQQILKYYKEQVKQKTPSKLIGDDACQFLYMRSFFSAYPVPGASFPAMNYYRKQAQQYWTGQRKYMQGMIALSLFRTGDLKTAGEIMASLKQNAIISDEMGMYWKENRNGYYWAEAPVEAQSLLIEAFAEINKNTATTNELKTWLLKQKQTQSWPTTKATADACYALLMQGSDWLNSQPAITIRLGDKTVSSSSESTEAGTGYFKKTFDGPFVNPGMGSISVDMKLDDHAANNGPAAWGAVYWQYFENLDKITTAATPLRVSKKLFISKNTASGPVLEPLGDNAPLRIGDKVVVRIEIRSDRNMEYIHMKDTRASGMEPVNVISAYKWQDGLGYYESTKDASTDFFFSGLNKGTYVFEYPLFVAQAGSFSNGITTIQCMYAPEFSAHSEGIHVVVEPLPQ